MFADDAAKDTTKTKKTKATKATKEKATKKAKATKDTTVEHTRKAVMTTPSIERHRPDIAAFKSALDTAPSSYARLLIYRSLASACIAWLDTERVVGRPENENMARELLALLTRDYYFPELIGSCPPEIDLPRTATIRLEGLLRT